MNNIEQSMMDITDKLDKKIFVAIKKHSKKDYDEMSVAEFYSAMVLVVYGVEKVQSWANKTMTPKKALNTALKLINNKIKTIKNAKIYN